MAGALSPTRGARNHVPSLKSSPQRFHHMLAGWAVAVAPNTPLAFSGALEQNSGMVFADLKNDFVFRRIFATHPEILRGLLNDLLERTGDRTIESLEYLPSEQLPLVSGAKLSILDVRCKDQRGTMFVVEMQLIHMSGFINRVVFNGCKAYVNQLKAGEPYSKLVDVIAISICDFALWPDAAQDAKGEPRIPMLSHYAMRERSSGNEKLLQVQYAFLELPKVPKEKPEGGAALWAWLFVNAPSLKAVPETLPVGSMREAMELANEATFSELEMDAYRKVMDEIEQARQFGEDKLNEGLAKGHKSGLAEGHKSGLAEGQAAGKSSALLTILGARGIAFSDVLRERITACKDSALLDQWIARAVTGQSAKDVFGVE